MGNTLTRKPRKYRSYLLEMPAHYESIMKKYGAPSIAQPPQLPEDIIERVITKMTPQMWNKSIR